MPTRPLLLVMTSAGAVPDGQGHLVDGKFLAGMARYASLWPGPVRALAPRAAVPDPFATRFDGDGAPFELRTFAAGDGQAEAMVAEADVALLSGDAADQLPLAEVGRRAGTAVAFVIENTLPARLQMAWLDPSRGALRKASSMLWQLRAERRRRAAFGLAHGLQANGFPAHAAYRGLNDRTLLYLDSRSDTASLATGEERAMRRARLAFSQPLRLLHSGRLEPLKGSQDVVPIAIALRRAGVGFTIDVFGTGSLDGPMRDAIARHDLGAQVRMHGAVPFESHLVPFARAEADAFLSCNRQSDPSCTYLESMACGLPIFGYGNAMWRALRDASGGGWSVGVGDVAAMADRIAYEARTPGAIADAADRAFAFAAARTFDHEFGARIAHLLDLLSGAAGRPAPGARRRAA